MISVIIPAYNAARFIRRTVDSVLGQTYKDIELIVVDDGSSDDTGRIIKEYGDKVRYIYQNNAGDGPARNTGILAAKGEWVAFLDHDDEWLPAKLALQMDLLERNPQLKWCAAAHYMQYGEKRNLIGCSNSLRQILKNDCFDNYFTAVRKGTVQIIWMSTVIIKRCIFYELGFFEAGWLRQADLDMWWRVAHRYPSVGFLSEPLAIMHLELQSGLNTILALKDTRGQDARRLVAKHIDLAKKYGDTPQFMPFAASFLFRILRTTLFNGFKEDARDIIKVFRNLFSWRLRFVVYVLTVFPSLTSALMRTFSCFRHKLGLKAEVTRPYTHKQLLKAQKESLKQN